MPAPRPFARSPGTRPSQNLTRALADTLTPNILAIISLVTSRHQLLARMLATNGHRMATE
jgi:hypothetical protein